MRVYLDGWNMTIKDVTTDEARAMLRMIRGASLEERRTFYHLKRQLEDLLEGFDGK